MCKGAPNEWGRPISIGCASSGWLIYFAHGGSETLAPSRHCSESPSPVTSSHGFRIAPEPGILHFLTVPAGGKRHIQLQTGTVRCSICVARTTLALAASRLHAASSQFRPAVVRLVSRGCQSPASPLQRASGSEFNPYPFPRELFAFVAEA